MKKGLVWSGVALAAIIIVASFGMQIGTITEPNIPESMAGRVLYVCPAVDSAWDSVASAIRPFSNYIIAVFFFGLVLLLFGWGWQLYQNLLADKFKRESFKNIWAFTKYGFWLLVLVMLVMFTPNNFRRVEITGAGDNWILCDATDAGARAVRADAVHSR
ncbi:MAG: hypothetical protein J5679_01185 [Alphaproteobacteria bacterium]|nr:hypothetical protein [Alphaproteobacteria bacterium]